MKILNLYAGIGGNRKLWTKENIGEDLDITAIELNPKIAQIYQDFFPNDKVIVADAHQYLLEHFEEYDFIWSSPPCPSHSKMRKNFSIAAGAKPVFPDMKLYEEIIFLKGHFNGKWCIENVIGWYEPIIPPQELQRHYFWANFHISDRNFGTDKITVTNNKDNFAKDQIIYLQEKHKINLDKYTRIDKKLLLRNCVTPELGLHILNESKKNLYPELFDNH